MTRCVSSRMKKKNSEQLHKRDRRNFDTLLLLYQSDCQQDAKLFYCTHLTHQINNNYITTQT